MTGGDVFVLVTFIVLLSGAALSIYYGKRSE